MRLASRAAVELPMKPISGIFPPCCARAANGHAATAPPRSATNFRRLMEASPPTQTPDEFRLSHSGATPLVDHSKICRPMSHRPMSQIGQKATLRGDRRMSALHLKSQRKIDTDLTQPAPEPSKKQGLRINERPVRGDNRTGQAIWALGVDGRSRRI